MNVCVFYPNDEAYIDIEKNVKKINALLIRETIKKKPYSQETQIKIMRKLAETVGLTSNNSYK